jgi:hypothetical protein
MQWVALLWFWAAASGPGQVDGGEAALDGAADGGVTAVDVHGLQVPIAADPTLPGHRPVEGVIDTDDLPLRPTPTVPERDIYDDFLDSRTSDFDNCAVWSPGGAAVKGWFVAEWVVRTEGHVERLRVIRSTLESPLIEACLLREISQWRFPRPAIDGQVVRHAFYFSSPARTDLLPPEIAP